ncbi:electron transport complex subunit RsxD [Mergibacter septicus]|uniref:Ion-translocating oxidoreductase complex subunit D n=1 Tax=Mergibacter septicus TaxID=221402 RepID=A0A8D4J210_9PAST|nr:electron transport complex subunit RsxD [Mergibacter septicus]AWX15375.1 electron transport complex subunit RsxD [Mergibacter septicus]QDJ14629.1 electron transport complex subunit RsxD [Mergibacter septicus]UTU47938.1 electron transport complex subunit RsxD [Mergibacter septicus]WMR96456.1 electron transport complex subunit RsxD [Mergibacter septicus]
MFKIASSPHTHSNNLTSRIMLWVMIAMLPAIAVQTYFFGFGTLIQISLALVFACGLEWLVTRLRQKSSWFYLSDLSVVLTALILAVSIPPYAPYWIILVGTFCAVILGKHVYGGLGQNLFNPAMVGYAILLVSFPVQMTAWVPANPLLLEPISFHDAYLLIFKGLSSDGYSLHQIATSIDAISQATPLDSVKTGIKKGLTLSEISQSPLFTQNGLTIHLGILFSHMAGLGWWQINFAFLIGGIFLIWKRIIHWQIPTAFLVTFALLTTLTWLIEPNRFPSPLWQLFSGATMFCAFFIATDPVTASITPKGKLIFGGLVALLLYVIRCYGGYPDGVAFSILLSNICVPLIDHYTRPRIYGH